MPRPEDPTLAAELAATRSAVRELCFWRCRTALLLARYARTRRRRLVHLEEAAFWRRRMVEVSR